VKLVNLLKEKSQQIQISNGEFIKKWEPQVRELKENFNQSVTNSFSNSFASAWFSRLMAVANEEQHSAVIPTSEVLELKLRLQSRLGQEIHIGDWHKLSQQDIDNFAEVTGDKQWIHVDPEQAKHSSPFKSTVAHGFLILSLIPKLRSLETYASLHYPNARLIVNCGLNNARFLAPVKPGNAIRTRSILRELVANKRSLDITEEIHIEIAPSRKEACTVEMITRVYLQLPTV
jgi:Acyl dehydratase